MRELRVFCFLFGLSISDGTKKNKQNKRITQIDKRQSCATNRIIRKFENKTNGRPQQQQKNFFFFFFFFEIVDDIIFCWDPFWLRFRDEIVTRILCIIKTKERKKKLSLTLDCVVWIDCTTLLAGPSSGRLYTRNSLINKSKKTGGENTCVVQQKRKQLPL